MDLLFSPLLIAVRRAIDHKFRLEYDESFMEKQNLGYQTVPFDTHQSLFDLVLWSQNCKWLF